MTGALLPLIGAVVGTGAGLHVAAYFLEEESKLDAAVFVIAPLVLGSSVSPRRPPSRAPLPWAR